MLSDFRFRRGGVFGRVLGLSTLAALVFLAGCAASNSNTVTIGPPTQLVFTTQPSSVAAGSSISPAVSVSIEDAQGHVVTTATNQVAIAIGTNPSAGTLGGTATAAAIAGVATFSNLSINNAGTGYTLAASATGLTGANSGAFNVTGAPTKLAFTVQPGNVAAGASIAPAITVSIEDALGNVVTSATSQVTVAIGTNLAGGTLSGTASANAAAGVATFSTLSINKVGTGYTLAATATGLTAATSSAFNVVAGAAAKLVFTAQPTNTTAGVAISPAVQVTVEDSQGNVVTTAANTITMGVGAGGGTLTGTTAVSAASGVATFPNLNINLAGNGYTLTATATGLTGATSSAFNVLVGAAAKLVLTTGPTNVAAGSSITPAVVVSVEDLANNVVPTAVNQITIAIGTNPSAGTLSGTAQANAVAGVATFSTLSINKTGNGYTLTAAAASLTGATSSAFNVTAGAASKLVITTQPTSATAGAAISPAVVVTVEDSQSNVVTNATNQITLAIATNPSAGTLSGTAQVNAVAGVATFSTLSINKTGTGYTLGASATGLTGATSDPFNIQAGTATKLAITAQPTTAVAGVAISPSVQVAVEDALGNTVSTAVNQITLAIATNPSAGTLSGTAQVNAVAGVATFSTLSINKSGNGYTLGASATALTAATSSAFNVTAAAASKLVFTGEPVNTVSGTSIAPSVTVTVEDQFSNVVTTANNLVTIAIGTNPAGGTLAGTASSPAVSGVATFSNLSINNTGNGYTLSASAAGLTGATSTAFNILVSIGPPAKLAFSVQPSNVVAGSSIAPAIQVTVEDASGNQVPTATNQITIAIGTNPSAGALSGTAIVNAVSGVATFSTLSINNAGTGYTLGASASGLTGATSSAFNVTAGAAAKLAFGVQPTAVSAASSITPAVQVSVQDSFGNLVTTATNQITVAIGTNPSAGTLSGTAQVNAVAGVASFSTLSINKAGTGYTLGASAAGLTSATSSAFNVTAGAKSKLAFTVQPSNVATGSSITPAITVSVEDAQGNFVTTATDQVTIAIGTNPASGTLSGTAQVNAVAGVATFSTLNINNIGTGYTFTASAAGLTGATSSAFNVTANCTNNCSVSGTVTGAWGSGVAVALSGGPSSPAPVTTDANGHYSFASLTAGSYTITPTLAGYTYTPTPPTINIGASTVQNFVATSAIQSFSISGTVSGSAASGIVYIRVFNCGGGTNCNDVAGTTLASISTNSGAYTIRGLPSGNNYSVTAEIDTLNTGAGNEANPFGSIAGVSITSANVTGANIILAAQTIDAPVKPNTPSVFPGSGAAFVSYKQPRSNNNGDEIATSYKLYYDTNSTFTNNTFKTITAGDSNNVFVVSGLTNATQYWFKISSVNANGESAASTVVGPITIGATVGSNTISGSVSFSGITPPAGSALYVGLFSNSTGVFFQRIANPTNPQAFSVSGVTSGTYQFFAILDINSSGTVGVGSVDNFGSNGPPAFTVAGSSSGNNITLTSVVAKTFIATSHQKSSQPDSYNISLSSDFGTKRPAGMTLFSGNNVAVPFDMVAERNNSFSPIFSNSVRPLTTDSYGILVSFSDGSAPQNLPVTVATVLDTFATSLAMNTGSPHTVNVPLLTWQPPSAPPAFYSYSVGLNQNGGPEFWNYNGGNNSNGIPSSQLNVVFNVDSSANPSSTLTTGTYDWFVQVQDDNGNSAQVTATYIVP